MGLENNITDDWIETTLGETTYFVSDKINTEELTINNYISTENLLSDKQGFVASSNLPNVSKVNSFKKEDVLFSNIRTYFKKVWFASKDGGSSNDVLIFRPVKEDYLNKHFLYRIISSDVFIDYTVKTAKGTKMPRGDKNAIKLFPINLPPLSEQKAIAKVLNAFDDKIELLQAQNKTLEVMAQTIFKEWFGKYQVGDELPEGWRVGEFGELFDLTMGLSPKGDSYNHDMNGVPLLNGAGDYSGEKLDPKRYTSSPTRINKIGDLVFCIRGTIGKIVFADKEYCLGRGVAALSPKEPIDKYFNYLKLNRIISKLTRNATGSVILGLSKDDIKKAELILPPRKTLDEFGAIVKPIFDKKGINQIQIQSLTKTRDTLLPKLMSGQIRVNNIKQTANA